MLLYNVRTSKSCLVVNNGVWGICLHTESFARTNLLSYESITLKKYEFGSKIFLTTNLEKNNATDLDDWSSNPGAFGLWLVYTVFYLKFFNHIF